MLSSPQAVVIVRGDGVAISLVLVIGQDKKIMRAQKVHSHIRTPAEGRAGDLPRLALTMINQSQRLACHGEAIAWRAARAQAH